MSHETVRFWWQRFGPMFAAEIRRRRVSQTRSSRWRCHLDEVFVKIYGVQHYFWRALDHSVASEQVSREELQLAPSYIRIA